MSLVMLSKIPLVKQINVCCNIHLNFDSGFTYSSSTECLICGFNKNLVAIKTFVERHVLRWNKEREREFGLVLPMFPKLFWSPPSQNLVVAPDMSTAS